MSVRIRNERISPSLGERARRRREVDGCFVLLEIELQFLEFSISNFILTPIAPSGNGIHFDTTPLVRTGCYVVGTEENMTVKFRYWLALYNNFHSNVITADQNFSQFATYPPSSGVK